MLDEESIYERSLAAGRVKIFAYRVTCVAQRVFINILNRTHFIREKKLHHIFIILDMYLQL